MKVLLSIILAVFCMFTALPASANIAGAHGVGLGSDADKSCAGQTGGGGSGFYFYFVGNGCSSISVDGYVPATGKYGVTTWIMISKSYVDHNPKTSDFHETSSMVTIDGSLPVAYQAITVTSTTKKLTKGLKYYSSCYTLVDSQGNNYTSFGTNACKTIDNQAHPLPSVSNVFKCSLEGGNAIDVSLGDIDRSKIGTVPGSTEGISKKISMTCTGQGSGNFNYTFSYTPISVGDNQLISTSSAGHGSTSGLGVALFMNGALVKPNVAIARTYSTGTQTETLKFEPIRDPAKPATYISTGSFTASAVLIISPE